MNEEMFDKKVFDFHFESHIFLVNSILAKDRKYA